MRHPAKNRPVASVNATYGWAPGRDVIQVDVGDRCFEITAEDYYSNRRSGHLVTMNELIEDHMNRDGGSLPQ